MSGDVTIGALKRLTTLLAGQDNDSVDINGGAIDGTPVGANSASTGAFSTITATGAITGSSTVTGTSFIDSTAIAAASTSTTMTAAGAALVGATAASVFPLARPTVGLFKFIRCSNATTSRKIKVSTSGSSGTINNSKTNITFSNTGDGVLLFGETSTRWGIAGSFPAGGTAIATS